MVDQASVLKDVPLLVVGFKNQLVLIHLADLTFGGSAAQVAGAAAELVTAEIGLHGASGHVAGLFLEEAKLLLGPPSEAIGRITLQRLTEYLHPQHHVEPQRLPILK